MSSTVELPRGWCQARIGDVVTPITSIDPASLTQGEFTYIDIGAIDSAAGAVVKPKKLATSVAPSRARKIVEEHDVLFSTVRPYLRAIAPVPALVDAVASTGFCVLRPACGMDPRFLLEWVRSDAFIDSVLPLQRGSSYPAVRDQDVNDRFIPLPPAAEQRRIADALDELLSGLSQASTDLGTAQKKLASYRQSLLKAAVEGALTAEWRVQNLPQETGAELLARILRERRARWEAQQIERFKKSGKAPPKEWQAKYSEPVPADAPPQNVLPEGWVWASLDQLLSDIRSGTAETSGREMTDHPVLKSSAVRQGSIDFGALNYLRADQSSRIENYLEVGDILITRLSGSVEYVGCCAVVPPSLPHGIQYPDRIFCGKPAWPHPNLADYLVMAFQAPLIRSKLEEAAKSTAGHKRISLSDLHSLPVPLPPSGEIDVIVEAVRLTHSTLSETSLTIEAGLRLAAAQRQNILRAAFAGQLVPQDPTDEPASVLLERIRAERASAGLAAAPHRRRKPSPVQLAS